MSVNHHLLAKATTDSVLANFKSGKWKCINGVGKIFIVLVATQLFLLLMQHFTMMQKNSWYRLSSNHQQKPREEYLQD